ncbi:hypothetical protein SAMN05216388_101415 [Halorientalis persicus]|uniref:Uncharacterized protein n=1 Tax=Halorientalis persicus TaxID=1367881 RepID=A0A1H8QJ33_9EURY|nr:hypothetical protein SAMN05216388_101415 [Halorientalis persicus]
MIPVVETGDNSFTEEINRIIPNNEIRNDKLKKGLETISAANNKLIRIIGCLPIRVNTICDFVSLTKAS